MVAHAKNTTAARRSPTCAPPAVDDGELNGRICRPRIDAARIRVLRYPTSNRW